MTMSSEPLKIRPNLAKSLHLKQLQVLFL